MAEGIDSSRLITLMEFFPAVFRHETTFNNPDFTLAAVFTTLRVNKELFDRA